MLFMLFSVALLVMFVSLSLLVCGLLDFRVCSGIGVNTLIRERGSMGGALAVHEALVVSSPESDRVDGV